MKGETIHALAVLFLAISLFCLGLYFLVFWKGR